MKKVKLSFGILFILLCCILTACGPNKIEYELKFIVDILPLTRIFIYLLI